MGMLLGIMPWNYPYYEVARFVGPNHIVGNTVLLKHAPQCPESATAIAQTFNDVGAPAGAYENIYASNEQIEWVIADPCVRGVSVTGSELAGGVVGRDLRVSSEEEAVQLANDTPFGLGSHVMANDPEQAQRVADRIDAGMVYTLTSSARTARSCRLAATKRSGFGRELGPLRRGGVRQQEVDQGQIATGATRTPCRSAS